MKIPFEINNENIQWAWCENQWGLQNAKEPQQKPVVVDFLSNEWRHRQRQGMGRQQILSKAIGLHKGTPSVIDATAGLGSDSFVIAWLGATVVAIEQQRCLSFLASEALKRAQDQQVICERLGDRLEFKWGDSVELISKLESAEVIYLDPMFPDSGKTALSGKEMQLLQLLTSPSIEDDQKLLQLARERAQSRVVVKRHLQAPALAEDVNHVYRGKTVRYDVYLSR